MSKALVIIKTMGIGDLCILISSIHAISKKIDKSVKVLAQKNTHAAAILEHDPYVDEVIELNEKEIKGFFGIIKKIKSKKFEQSYIYSDSIRFYLISKLSGIKENFHYEFFSKRGKNFFKTAKAFTEKILDTKIDSQSKIYCDKNDIENAKRKYNITSATKNYIISPSASGPTKRWPISNFIKLLEELNKKHLSKYFIAAGPNDENLVKELLDSSVGKNCISLSKNNISEIMPIIAACSYNISNDTGFAHIASGLGLKCLVLFMDSPPLAYGVYSKNISIVVPDGETIESTGHNTRGKISFVEVLKKSLELIS